MIEADSANSSAAPDACRDDADWSTARRVYATSVLCVVGVVNMVDRQIITILLEPIKAEFQLTDTSMGLLTGTVFGTFYILAGAPLARWSDVGVRRSIVGMCLAFWSVMTAMCGLAQAFWQLALARIGVAIGESGAGPATSSMLADLYPLRRRGTVFGIYSASQALGIHWGWRWVDGSVTGTVGGRPSLPSASQA